MQRPDILTVTGGVCAMTRDSTVAAVLDRQLETFLESIGELRRVTTGEAVCSICGDSITLEKISLVVPIGDRVTYVCSSQACMLKYTLGEALDA